MRRQRDRDAIAEVLHEYCAAVDEARLEDLLDLFTEDGRFDRGFGVVYEGRTGLAALLGDSLAQYAASSHHLTNVRIEVVDRRTAHAKSYVYGYYRYADSGRTGRLWARYHDRLVKRHGRWRLAERAIRVAGWEDPLHADRLPFEPMKRGGDKDRYNI